MFLIKLNYIFSSNRQKTVEVEATKYNISKRTVYAGYAKVIIFTEDDN